MNKYFDLSPGLSEETVVWPGDSPVVIREHKSIEKGAGYNLTSVSLSSHSGSHVDAPRHFYPDSASVDELPLDTLIGTAQIIEITADSVDEKLLEEKLAGKNIERLIIKTRNSSLWSNPNFDKNYVSLTNSGADCLINKGIKLVGIDYLSIESIDSRDAYVHKVLLQNGIVIIEGLNLSEVQSGEYELFCLPLKLEGIDGAPARVVVRQQIN